MLSYWILTEMVKWSYLFVITIKNQKAATFLDSNHHASLKSGDTKITEVI